MVDYFLNEAANFGCSSRPFLFKGFINVNIEIEIEIEIDNNIDKNMKNN